MDICGVRSGINSILINSDLSSDVGKDNIFMSEDRIFASSIKALERARVILEFEKRGEIYAAGLTAD